MSSFSVYLHWPAFLLRVLCYHVCIDNQYYLSVAMDRIPTFRGHANGPGETAGPQHQGTIHLNSESTSMVDKAFADACQGFASDR